MKSNRLINLENSLTFKDIHKVYSNVYTLLKEQKTLDLGKLLEDGYHAVVSYMYKNYSSKFCYKSHPEVSAEQILYLYLYLMNAANLDEFGCVTKANIVYHIAKTQQKANESFNVNGADEGYLENLGNQSDKSTAENTSVENFVSDMKALRLEEALESLDKNIILNIIIMMRELESVIAIDLDSIAHDKDSIGLQHDWVESLTNKYTQYFGHDDVYSKNTSGKSSFLHHVLGGYTNTKMSPVEFKQMDSVVGDTDSYAYDPQ